jgi:glutaredoxin 3
VKRFTSLSNRQKISQNQAMTASPVIIFGKDTCPYTQAARDDYARRHVEVQYFNVKKNAADLKRMLEYSQGRRLVPVIVDGGKVTIGFGGT